jgi:hypothetical protein
MVIGEPCPGPDGPGRRAGPPCGPQGGASSVSHVTTLVAVFALAVAVLVAALWVGSLARGAVPELVSRPREIRFHIAAELAMAALLAVAGLLTLAGVAEAEGLLLVGFGAVLYSIVNSAGYYAERRDPVPLIMFGVLFVLTVAAIGAIVAT